MVSESLPGTSVVSPGKTTDANKMGAPMLLEGGAHGGLRRAFDRARVAPGGSPLACRDRFSCVTKNQFRKGERTPESRSCVSSSTIVDFEIAKEL